MRDNYLSLYFIVVIMEKILYSSHIEHDYMYKGVCPICGMEQMNSDMSYVDIICVKCIYNIVLDRIGADILNNVDDKNMLVGSVILECEDISPCDAHDGDVKITVLTPTLQLDHLYSYVIKDSLSHYFGSKQHKLKINKIESKRDIITAHKSFLDKLMSLFK